MKPKIATLVLLVALASIGALPVRAAYIEPNASGDIPDTQAFVRYTSPAGYSVLFPEGWSRTVQPSRVTFTSNFNGEAILLRARSSPEVAVRGLAPRVSAVKVSKAVLAGISVPLVRFTAPSASDPVTGKSVRLDGEAYVFVRGARQAVLYLWAPHGADNADQWKKIAQSFHWR
jgi:hypothetical protein